MVIYRVAFAILVLMTISCKNEKIIVYEYNTGGNNEIIKPQFFYKFYEESEYSKRKEIFNESYIRELKIIKDTVHEIDNLRWLTLLGGTYEYSFIISKDTIYANSNLKSWRWKDKTGIYESSITKQLLSELKEDNR